MTCGQATLVARSVDILFRSGRSHISLIQAQSYITRDYDFNSAPAHRPYHLDLQKTTVWLALSHLKILLTNVLGRTSYHLPTYRCQWRLSAAGKLSMFIQGSWSYVTHRMAAFLRLILSILVHSHSTRRALEQTEYVRPRCFYFLDLITMAVERTPEDDSSSIHQEFIESYLG
jgi:hypothetical protein